MAAWIARSQAMVTNDTPDVGFAQLLLADWLGRAWRFNGAGAVLAAAASVLGSDHPDTLTARNDLAVTWHAAERTTDAITLQETVLTDRERLLDPNTPTPSQPATTSLSPTGTRDAPPTPSLSRKPSSPTANGSSDPNTPTPSQPATTSPSPTGRQSARATPSPSKNWSSTDRERLLGPQHPDTLTARNNLAGSYWQAGRTTECHHPPGDRPHNDRERLLGPEHPEAPCTARNNLALSYRQASAPDPTRSPPPGNRPHRL